MTAKLFTFESRRERNRKRIPIGPNQLSLIKALWFAEGNQFRSLRAWYRSPHAIGGSREARRQSCWAVIGRGWVTAKRNGRGPCRCTLTKAGRDIAEGRVLTRITWRKDNKNARCLPKGVQDITDDFDGFLTPTGELVSNADTGRMLSILASRTENRDRIAEHLRSLAEYCSDIGNYKAACDHLRIILSIVDDPGGKTECLLRMGQVLEGARDFEAALEAYLRAFELPNESNDVWYFLNNNTGFCLNKAGRYAEAERYC